MHHVDLAVIGSGSGNTIVNSRWDGHSVALIEHALFGGTCLNTGCIPTKMYVHTADVAQEVLRSGRFGVDSRLDGVRWPDVRDRIFGRLDPISARGREHRQNGKNITFLEGTASFTGPRCLAVETAAGVEELTADQVVIAAGSHAIVPAVITESGVPFHTSDTVMRIDALPESMVILGGGYIAAEMAHIFSSLGTAVRIVTRGPSLLTAQDPAVSQHFTDFASRRWPVYLSADVTGARVVPGGVELSLADGTTVAGSLLLVATGRAPSTDALNLDAAGVALREDGRIRVDDFGRTSADGIWALGDVSSAYQLKHVANAEARTVGNNLVVTRDGSGALRELPEQHVPSAVFTDPQIATIGETSTQLDARGARYVVGTKRYGDTAFGWALEDEESFCRVYADHETGALLGGHIIGPDAATLIQPLITGIAFGLKAHDLAREQYWIHPALTEVVENALLEAAKAVRA